MTVPKPERRLPTTLVLAVLAAGLALVTGAVAQDLGQAFKGLSADSDDPIQIEADRLEVLDTEKVAVYIGNVRVRQGETVLKTAQLRVFYTGEPEGNAPGASVSRIEASSRVVVQSGDQTASGDSAVFEMTADRITLTGNVVLTEGKNIVRGDRLVVDLKTRRGRMEGDRVQTILTPNRVRSPQ